MATSASPGGSRRDLRARRDLRGRRDLRARRDIRARRDLRCRRDLRPAPPLPAPESRRGPRSSAAASSEGAGLRALPTPPVLSLAVLPLPRRARHLAAAA